MRIGFVGLVACVLAGCSGDPGMDVLRPGTQAVVVNGMGDGTSDGAILKPSAPRNDLEAVVGVEVSPGVRVTIGDDAGYIEWTQADIDRGIKLNRVGNPAYADSLRKEAPRRYTAPHERARLRPVRVVIETGEHADLAGTIRRLDLRPVR